ncbi:hypothetical protein SLE2022_157990 [Rubroshorea leprosula]
MPLAFSVYSCPIRRPPDTSELVGNWNHLGKIGPEEMSPVALQRREVEGRGKSGEGFGWKRLRFVDNIGVSENKRGRRNHFNFTIELGKDYSSERGWCTTVSSRNGDCDDVPEEDAGDRNSVSLGVWTF